MFRILRLNEKGFTCIGVSSTAVAVVYAEFRIWDISPRIDPDYKIGIILIYLTNNILQKPSDVIWNHL